MAKKKNPAIRFLDPTVESFETIVGPRTVFRGNIAAFESIRIDALEAPWLQTAMVEITASVAAGTTYTFVCVFAEGLIAPKRLKD